VIDCLLHDGAGPIWEDETISDVNIDDIFSTCDINQDGKVLCMMLMCGVACIHERVITDDCAYL
jgi:hypothetical protein